MTASMCLNTPRKIVLVCSSGAVSVMYVESGLTAPKQRPRLTAARCYHAVPRSLDSNLKPVDEIRSLVLVDNVQSCPSAGSAFEPIVTHI